MNTTSRACGAVSVVIVAMALVLCQPAAAQITTVAAQDLARTNALEALGAAADVYVRFEPQDTELYVVCKPAIESIAASGAMQLDTTGYLVLVKGRMSSANADTPESERVYQEGILAQFRCDADGCVRDRTVFSRPVTSFGRIGLGPEEAARAAGLSVPLASGSAVLIETRPLRFSWQLESGGGKYYVDTNTASAVTELEMIERLAPGALDPPPEPWAPTGDVYQLYEGHDAELIQMVPNTMGVIFDADVGEEACRTLLSSYTGVGSFEKVELPPAFHEAPEKEVTWLVRFQGSRSAGELQQTALDLSSQNGVNVACPVFRMQDIDGSVFDFMLTYILNVTSYPAGVDAMDRVLGAREGLEVLARVQTAPEYPVRYAVRANPARIPVLALIDFSNGICKDANTKYAGLRKSLVYHPSWKTLDNGGVE